MRQAHIFAGIVLEIGFDAIKANFQHDPCKNMSLPHNLRS